jgi:type VI secretion system secreted protein VgrG
MPLLDLSFASGEDSLSVRRFSVREAMSTLFEVSVWAASRDENIDLRAIVGQPASLRIVSGWKYALLGGARLWTGVCSYMEQVQPEPTGESLYYIRIVPALWLLTQRRGYRIHQHVSIPDIVDKLLAEWGVEPVWKIDRERYPKLEYKVQYGETDYAFMSRLLEEAGVAFYFPDDDAKGSRLVLADEPQGGDPRAAPPVHYVDNPNQAAEMEFVTRVRLGHEVRPGAHTLRDYDFRNPVFPLFSEAGRAPGPEDRYEQYHYEPGSFLVETGKGGGGTPAADDKGVARYDQRWGTGRAARALEATRTGQRAVAFDTNTVDLWPGAIFSIANHPRSDLTAADRLLVTDFSIEGTPGDEWSLKGRAVFADQPYRPEKRTPKPALHSVQSATVVGPEGQEIHTDEFARVRVQFPWDREGQSDDFSSCWIRVSQGWAGVGFGAIMLPRIGQEVLVGFLEGDPDQPIIVGRVFNNTNQVPYKLPEHKTRSTWKSDSSLGSDGFNEILFEDLKHKELVYEQAQKNLRRLVKNDEAITVGKNRQKLVKGNELETTALDRFEVTGMNRTEVTGLNRTTIIGAASIEDVVSGENENEQAIEEKAERTGGNMRLLVTQNQDIIIEEVKRELVGSDDHLHVVGHRLQKIDRSQSLTVGEDRQEQVGRNHALEVGEEYHLKAGAAVVIEAAHDLTIKGPGGFVRIDSSGVTIVGTIVRINSGGEPGEGSGANPAEPEDAVVEAPGSPEPDDIFRTGLAQ